MHLKKPFPYILFIIVFISCGKDDLTPELIDNKCSSIARYKQEKEMVEIYGDSFIFRNINNQQQKEFKYSLTESRKRQFNDTILCTHLTFDELTTLKYNTDDSDFIIYNVSQYFDGRQQFGCGISSQIIQLNGQASTDLRYLTNNLRLATMDDFTNMLVFVNDESVFLGFDDLNGEQWLLNTENEDIFYCEVLDNFDEYLDTEEYEAFNSLANKTLKYTDGLATTATFQNESQIINTYYSATETEDCPEQKLLINQTADMTISYRFANIYSLFLNIVPNYQDPTSDKKYTKITLHLNYVRENQLLHNITFVIDPHNIFEENYFTPTPFVFHDKIEINELEYNEVYEFKSSNKSLFFNYDHGILAFTDHLGIMNYLEEE